MGVGNLHSVISERVFKSSMNEGISVAIMNGKIGRMAGSENAMNCPTVLQGDNYKIILSERVRFQIVAADICSKKRIENGSRWRFRLPLTDLIHRNALKIRCGFQRLMRHYMNSPLENASQSIRRFFELFSYENCFETVCVLVVRSRLTSSDFSLFKHSTSPKAM